MAQSELSQLLDQVINRLERETDPEEAERLRILKEALEAQIEAPEGASL